MSLAFAPFDPADLDAQRALFEDAFPENRGQPVASPDHYHWKFHTFPAAPPSYEYSARDESGLVGHYAALPYPYEINDERMTCGMVCDVMTATRMQGKGVFTKLGAYALGELTQAGIDFVSGYPIRPAVIPGHLKVGWHVAFELPMYLLPLRADALLASRGAGFLAAPVNAGLWAYHGAVGALRRTGEVTAEVLGLEDFLARVDFDAFAAQWRAGKRNALVKSAAFLRWRLAAPGTRYRIVCVFRAGRLSGVSIVRPCTLQGVPSLAVLDYMSLEHEAMDVAAMLTPWRALAAETGSEVVVMMVNRPQARRMRLGAAGFVKTPAVFSLILNALSARAKEKLTSAAEDWHLMWLDSDDL